MRVWLGVAILGVMAVLANAQAKVIAENAEYRTAETTSVSGAQKAVDEHHDHDDRDHHSKQHCFELIGAGGCASTAPALAASGNWTPLLVSWTLRHPTVTRIRDSIALAPPKRPPRLS